MGPECQINEVRKDPKFECGTKCQINVDQNVKVIWVQNDKLM